jgi:A/G-specific adenine glycosylase
MADIRAALLSWYAAAHRDFPWRHTIDPYAVLVSEVMLQQTQASRVALRFPAFIERFPTARDLGSATEGDVLAAWSGLGYNRRALALRKAAAIVARAGWPSEVRTLQNLPGIGPYTARAVASLAFGQPVGVVDTNVRRWLVRRFGLDPATGAKDLQAIADRLAGVGDQTDAAAWTHATMEFGASICTTRLPACGRCPIAADCPSRDKAARVPVARQPRFSGSDRARRGALVHALTQAPAHSLTLAAARRLCPDGDFQRIVDGLDRDGLAHRSGGRLHLGGREESAATIES